jgi:hypothetical protein
VDRIDGYRQAEDSSTVESQSTQGLSASAARVVDDDAAQHSTRGSTMTLGLSREAGLLQVMGRAEC